MKKTIYMLLVFVGSMTFMGCPYKTKINLESNPSEKVQKDLLGNFEKKGYSSYKYSISKKSDNKYTIKEIKVKDGTLNYEFEGYTTTIKGTQFLVTKKVKSSTKDYTTEIEPEYYIYKITSNSSKTIVKLEEVTEFIKDEFTSAADLKAFIGKYKDLTFFYKNTALKYYKEIEDEDF